MVWHYRQTDGDITISPLFFWKMGWLCEAKLLCILCHQGIQLILAYSLARPAILVSGKGRGGRFLFLLFLHFHSFSFLPCPSLSSPLLSLLPLSCLSLGGNTKWPTKADVWLNPNSINQSSKSVEIKTLTRINQRQIRNRWPWWMYWLMYHQ